MGEGGLIYLRQMARIGAMCGQFAVKSLKSEIYEFSLFSSWGIWSIILFLYNVLMGQTIFISVTMITPFPKEITTGFSGKIMKFISIYHMLLVYIVYVVFLMSLPKFINTINQLLKFDKKHNKAPEFKFMHFLRAMMFSTDWWVEGILGIISTVRTVNYLGELDNFGQLLKWSWAFGTFEYDFETLEIVIKILTSIHFFICQFGNCFAIQLILALSYISGACLKNIEDCILERCKVGRYQYQNVLWVVSDTSKKGGQGSAFIDTDLILDQIIQLTDVISNLREASNGIILIVTGLTTLSVTMLVYSSFNFLKLWNHPSHYLIPVSLLLYLIVGVLKLVWLANCGEHMLFRVSIVNLIRTHYRKITR